VANRCQNRENTITGRKTRSYSKETVLQSALILAKSGRLEMADNILRTGIIGLSSTTVT